MSVLESGVGTAGNGGDAVHVSMLVSVAWVLPGVAEMHRRDPHERAGICGAGAAGSGGGSQAQSP